MAAKPSAKRLGTSPREAGQRNRLDAAGFSGGVPVVFTTAFNPRKGDEKQGNRKADKKKTVFRRKKDGKKTEKDGVLSEYNLLPFNNLKAKKDGKTVFSNNGGKTKFKQARNTNLQNLRRGRSMLLGRGDHTEAAANFMTRSPRRNAREDPENVPKKNGYKNGYIKNDILRENKGY